MIRPVLWLALLGAFAACEGEIAAPPDDLALEPTGPFEPAPGQMRRITQSQYGNLVHDLLGEDIVLPPSLEPDVQSGGLFAVGSSTAGISSRGVDQYERAAFSIAEQALAADRRDTFLPCTPTDDADTSCMEHFVRTIGRRAWRRPLTGEEIDRLLRVGLQATAALGDIYRGFEFIVATILQSPDFLFRIEVGRDGAEGREFTSWEVAERLSFFLWNTGPDDALLDAASRGELQGEQLHAWVDAMLADPRAKQGLRAFFSEMLGLDELDELRKDPAVFAHIGPDVGPSAREETLRLIEYLVFDQDADYRDLMTTRTTFINRKLASIYGVRSPSRDDFARFDFPEDSLRRGVLGHVSVLAAHSHFGSSSATLRGAFVRRNLMCGSIPPPPADVDTSIPPPLPGAATLRDRVARHLEDPSCAGCHRLMDPLGLGLENFDALGRIRFTDNEQTIDASGVLNGVEFADPLELGEVIAQSEDYPLCLSRTMYRYATGHIERPSEAASLRAINQSFEASGYRVLALMRTIATSEGFLSVGDPRESLDLADTEEVEGE